MQHFTEVWKHSKKQFAWYNYTLRAQWTAKELFSQATKENILTQYNLFEEKNIPVSSRYKCLCNPNVMENEEMRLRNQTTLTMAGGTKRFRCISISVDKCIVDAIIDLWTKGVETTGSCCGHNKLRAWVQVIPGHYEKMFEMGYIQRPVENHGRGVVRGLYAFYL